MLKHWYHQYNTRTGVLYNKWLAQSFTPDSSFSCSGISFFVFKSGNLTGVLTLSLFLADANGNPSGPALASASIDYVNAWYYNNPNLFYVGPLRAFFDVPVDLVSGIQYVFVISSSSGSSNYFLVYHQNIGTYTGGNMKISTNNGASWTDTSSDIAFDLWDNTLDGIEYVALVNQDSMSRIIRIHHGTNGNTIVGSFSLDGSDGKLCKTESHLYAMSGGKIFQFTMNLDFVGFFQIPSTSTSYITSGFDVSESQRLAVYTTYYTSSGKLGVMDLDTGTELWYTSYRYYNCCAIHPTKDYIVSGISPGSGGWWNGSKCVASTGENIFNFWANGISLREVIIRLSDEKIFAINNNSSGNANARLYYSDRDSYVWSTPFDPKGGYVHDAKYIEDDEMLYVATGRDSTGQRSLYKLDSSGNLLASIDLGNSGRCICNLDSDHILVGSNAGDDGGGSTTLRMIRKSDLSIVWRCDPFISNVVFDINFVNVIPKIVDQTISESSTVGTEIVLFVVATGSPTPTYQWYRNDVLIPDETSSTLNITIGHNTDGVYKCVVSNIVGSVTSDDILVSVIDNCTRNLFEIPSDLIIEE